MMPVPLVSVMNCDRKPMRPRAGMRNSRRTRPLPIGGLTFIVFTRPGLARSSSSVIHSVVTSDELFEAGDRVIQYGRSRGTVLANGATFDMPEVHVWTLRDGKVTAADFYIDTPAMLRVLGRAS